MRVAVISPSLALRAGLRALIQGEAIEVTQEAADLDDFSAQPAPGGVDVLLLTAQALVEDRLRAVLEADPGSLGVVVLTDSPGLPQLAQVLLALPLRAWGLLPLEAPPEELQAALQAVQAGLVAAPPALFLHSAARQLLAAEALDALAEALTGRETQVLNLLAQGLANKQIAVTLGISEHTVKFHISAIYGKLGVNNRTEAVRHGVQRGLILL